MLGLLGDRLDHRPHQEGQQRQLRPVGALLLVERGAQFLERGDVDLLDIGDVRDARFRQRHLLGDLAAQADDLDLLDRSVAAPGPAARAGLRPARQEGVEVLMRDAAGRAAAGDLAQIDAGLPAPQAHRRRGQRLFALGARRAGRALDGPAAFGGAARRGFRRWLGRPCADGFGAARLPSASALAAFAGVRLPRGRGRRRQRHCPRPPPSAGRSASRPPPCRRSRRRATATSPSTGDGISTVALSVMTAASSASSRTRSPTLTCHSTSSASATPSPTSGSLMTCSPISRLHRFDAAPGRPAPGRGNSPIPARADRACPSRSTRTTGASRW